MEAAAEAEDLVPEAVEGAASRGATRAAAAVAATEAWLVDPAGEVAATTVVERMAAAAWAAEAKGSR
jgi:predicted hotdog family 3-hydroxylacyl-ACP dehydratase